MTGAHGAKDLKEGRPGPSVEAGRNGGRGRGKDGGKGHRSAGERAAWAAKAAESRRVGAKRRALEAMLSRVDRETREGVADLVENAAFVAVRLDEIRADAEPDMRRYGELVRVYQNIQRHLLAVQRSAGGTDGADELAEFDAEYPDG